MIQNADSAEVLLRSIINYRRLLRLRPRAEQGRADAHNCRAFFNGDFEITAHAHAQMRQWRAEHLLDRRWPMKCQRARLGHCGIFAFASCTLFSPKKICPSLTASLTSSGGIPLLTASNVTESASRPARRHAAWMRC